MTTEEKFNAAVNVIRSLPKNGSYQPSNELMLRFYGYFKQATQGPCKGARPAFWDVVGRAKYDAWKNLGDMSKADAMSKYVEELHRIVETMSYTDKVANFLEAPSNELDTISFADLELVAGDVLERVRSQPNSPLASREASPQRIHSSLGSSPSISPTPPDDSDHSDEEYIDTVEAPEPKKPIPNGTIYSEPVTNGNKIIQKEHKSRSKSKVSLQQNHVDITQEVSKAVQSLQNEIDRLMNKINVIEKQQHDVKTVVQKKKKYWFFNNISPQFIAFIIAWPFIAHFIMNRFMIRNRK